METNPSAQFFTSHQDVFTGFYGLHATELLEESRSSNDELEIKRENEEGLSLVENFKDELQNEFEDESAQRIPSTGSFVPARPSDMRKSAVDWGRAPVISSSKFGRSTNDCSAASASSTQSASQLSSRLDDFPEESISPESSSYCESDDSERGNEPEFFGAKRNEFFSFPDVKHPAKLDGEQQISKPSNSTQIPSYVVTRPVIKYNHTSHDPKSSESTKSAVRTRLSDSKERKHQGESCSVAQSPEEYSDQSPSSPKDSGRIKFKCYFCCQVFFSKEDMLTHLRLHYRITPAPARAAPYAVPYRCNICHLRFPKESTILAHILAHSFGDTELSQYDSDLPFLDLQDQYSPQSRSSELPQKTPPVKIADKTRIEMPKLDPISKCPKLKSISYPCKLCKKRFENKKSLETHQEIQKKGKIKCKTCEKKFCFLILLQEHMTLSHKPPAKKKPFKCSHCPKEFSHKGTLGQHENTHLENCRYKCETCKKPFSNRTVLKIHSKKHTGKSDFQCKTCLRYFNRSGDLRNHEKTHEEGYRHPFACEVCSKTFSDKHNFRRHVAVMHFSADEKPIRKRKKKDCKSK